MSIVIPTVGRSAETVTEFIRNVCKKIDELKDGSDLIALREVFETLSNSYFKLQLFRDLLSKELINSNAIVNISKIVKEFKEKGYFQNDNIWFCAYYAFNSIWNFSDYSQEIADSILKTDLFATLLANACHKPYAENIKSKNIYYLLKSNISIIHNITRHPGNENPFKTNEFKNVLVNFIRINDSDFLGIISMLTLSTLVDEAELHLLEEGKSTIKTLISKIKVCKMRNPPRIDGFAMWELLNGLRMIAVNDNMKKTIVKEDGLNLVIDILKSPSCDEDIEYAMGIAWNLCFDKDIRSVFNNVFNLKNVIKQFEHHSNGKIKRAYEGIIWLIDQKQQSVERVKSAVGSRQKSSNSAKWKFHVFLSYSWANKQIVLSVRDELVKSKYKVWIDVDQMKGSTLEAMADGIETSHVFVMAVSEAYRTSPNCRTEAEYAFSLKKPIIPLIVEFKYKPTGWLGLIIGSKTYFEFSERRNFGESITGLNNALLSLTDSNNTSSDSNTYNATYTNEETVEEPITASSAVPLGHDVVDRGPSRNSTFQDWKKTDIEKWLISSKLGHHKSKFGEFDGPMFLSMIDLSHKSPDYFYQTLKTELGFKLFDVIKFNAAVGKLNL